MRPNSAAEPMPQAKPLHPVLHHALANLDVQLEEELARYRRQRTGRTRKPTSARSRPLDLISVTATAAPRIPAASPPVAAPSPPVALPSSALDASLSTPPAIDPNSILANAPVPTNPVETQIVEAKQSDDSAFLTPDQPPEAKLAEAETELDDYLESSEELLKSLAEEEAEVQAERGFMQSLLTPLGLGSMLLLLVSSALFGFVVMNPTSLSQWFASLGRSSSTASAPSDSATTPTAPTSSSPPQPNLAAKEFKDLDLGTLGSLKVSPKGATGSPATKPAASAKSSANLGASGSSKPATPAIAPSTESRSNSAPAANSSSTPPEREPELTRITPAEPPAAPVSDYTPPAPQRRSVEAAPAPSRRETPLPAAPEPPAPKRAANPSDYPYKVVTPYTGDASLDAAQKTDPDAFVNSDGQIQRKASSTEAEARAKVEELQKQGISAEVKKR